MFDGDASRLAVALERRGAVDERDVRGRIGDDVLRSGGSRGRCRHATSGADEARNAAGRETARAGRSIGLRTGAVRNP